MSEQYKTFKNNFKKDQEREVLKIKTPNQTLTLSKVTKNTNLIPTAHSNNKDSSKSSNSHLEKMLEEHNNHTQLQNNLNIAQEVVSTVNSAQQPKTVKKKVKFPISNEQYKEILQILGNKYPITFNSEFKPLAINVHKQLFEELQEIPKKLIKGFLIKYCRSREYAANHIIGAARFNLKGTIEGEVTNEHLLKKNLKQTVKSKPIDSK